MRIVRPPSTSQGRALWGALFFLLSGYSWAAVTAGGLALIGYTDNASTDSFTLVALDNIQSGEVIYFTNNGWSNASRAFAGSTVDGSFGAGYEQVMKLTVNSYLEAGTIFSSADTSSSDFTWTTSGVIPTNNPSNTQTFSHLDLKYGILSKDEIYIFQASSDNPLLNVSNFIYALDMGDPDESPTGFVDPIDVARGGNVPNGEVSVDNNFNYQDVPTVALGENGLPNDNTATELNPDGEEIRDFYNDTFGFDLTDEEILVLQVAGGTKEDWLALISNRDKWKQLISQPTGSLNVTPIPEPSRTLLLLGGLTATVLRRRRKM